MMTFLYSDAPSWNVSIVVGKDVLQELIMNMLNATVLYLAENKYHTSFTLNLGQISGTYATA